MNTASSCDSMMLPLSPWTSTWKPMWELLVRALKMKVWPPG